MYKINESALHVYPVSVFVQDIQLQFRHLLLEDKELKDLDEVMKDVWGEKLMMLTKPNVIP